MPPAEAQPVVEVWLATPEAADRFDPEQLSSADRTVWEGIRTPRRRQDWASSRALLAAAAPAIGQARSLSHSRGYAALALAGGATSLGVDVEWLAPRNCASLAELAFCPAEAAYLASLHDPATACALFYELWTLKEAFAKALGLPLADALRQCTWEPGGDAMYATIPTRQPWQAVVFAPRPELRLALAIVGDSANPPVPSIRAMEWPPAAAAHWPVVHRWSAAGRATDPC
jgi:4'-phosphopantetheinyl transferase